MLTKKYILGSAMEILLLYAVLIFIAYYDYKEKIILDSVILLLLIYGIIKSINTNQLENAFLGACTYPIGLLLIYSTEDYFKKQLIGFGDVKLMMALGAIAKYKNIYNIVMFYQLLFIISGLYSIMIIVFFKKKKSEYIAFGPLIILTFVLLWR